MFNPESPPELQTSRWFNVEKPLTLEGLKGHVVVVTVFQALCPASLKHALPQAGRLAQAFNEDQVAVIGLHSPFERLEKQTPGDVEALIAEQGFSFPIAIDKPNVKKLPRTFSAYELQGTPTVLLFDRQGRLRRHYLGQVDDVRLAAEMMAFSLEGKAAPREESLAIERGLGMALKDPQQHVHGDDCGCGHDHDHGHHHHHGHDHHHHDHDHSHDHDHDHAPSHGEKAKA
jgi:thiol-disulfide isomerase/thioredoxin